MLDDTPFSSWALTLGWDVTGCLGSPASSAVRLPIPTQHKQKNKKKTQNTTGLGKGSTQMGKTGVIRASAYHPHILAILAASKILPHDSLHARVFRDSRCPFCTTGDHEQVVPVLHTRKAPLGPACGVFVFGRGGRTGPQVAGSKGPSNRIARPREHLAQGGSGRPARGSSGTYAEAVWIPARTRVSYTIVLDPT